MSAAPVVGSVSLPTAFSPGVSAYSARQAARAESTARDYVSTVSFPHQLADAAGDRCEDDDPVPRTEPRRLRVEIRDALRSEWPLIPNKRGGLAWPSTRKCGVVRRMPDVLVTLAKVGASGMQARTDGICSCNSVHACPVDAAKILAKGAQRIHRALNAHNMAKSVMVTLTPRHKGRFGHDAKRMYDGVQASIRWFSSGREYQSFALGAGFRVMNEVTGKMVNRTISALETTHSEKNGWHVHKHDLWLLDQEIGKEFGDAERALAGMTFTVRRWRCDGQVARRRYRGQPARPFRRSCGFVAEAGTRKGPCRCGCPMKMRSIRVNGLRWVRERWARAVVLKMGEDYRPSYERGVVMTSVWNGNYVTKMGLELTDAGFKKPGSPWALAWNFAYYGNRLALRRFLEYAAAAKGHKKLTWGIGLKELYSVDVPTPEEEAALAERKGVDISQQVIPGDHWDHVNRIYLAQLRVCEAAERAGDASAALLEVELMANERAGIRCSVVGGHVVAIGALAKTRPPKNEPDYLRKLVLAY